jgi:myo-inositol-1(or 4)-monophosphatase
MIIQSRNSIKNSMSTDPTSRINAILKIVESYIPYFRNNFSTVHSNWKSDATRVTESDLYLSDNILQDLSAQFPEDAYCSEEIGDIVIDLTQSEYSWILDPIDGTNNFALGMASCCISVGLLKDGIPIYGVIYDYGLDKIIHGGNHQGSFIGQNKVQVIDAQLDKNTLFAIQAPMSDKQLKMYTPLLQNFSIRSFGSGALNMVYAGIGFLHGCVEFRVRVWDIAAAYPIVLAAGGKVDFFEASVFPLKTFHTKLERCAMVAGTDEFCLHVLQLMDLERKEP